MSLSSSTPGATLWFAVSLALCFLTLPSHAFVVTPASIKQRDTFVSTARTSPTILKEQQHDNEEKQEEPNFLLSSFALYNGEVVDPYETLQVDRQATTATIRQAYHRLCRHYHPDAVRRQATELQDATRQEWERITWSYELLSNPRQRRKYDVHYAVAYPGETLKRAATALVWMSFTVLSQGLSRMGSVAAAKMMEYQQQQQKQQRGLVPLVGMEHPSMSQPQPNISRPFFLQAFTQGLSRLCNRMVARIMGRHFQYPYEQEQQHRTKPSSSLVLDGESTLPPDGCQPFSVAVREEFANVMQSIKKFW